MMRLLELSPACLALLLFSHPFAQAEESESITDAPAQWEMVARKMVAVDGTDAGRGADLYSYIEIVGTRNIEGPILTMSCQQTSRGNSALQVAIQLDPENDYESNPKRRLRRLARSGKLTIGENTFPERWSFHPASTKLVPLKRTVARKIFNAIVTKQPVTLTIQKKDYPIALPDADDVFRRFVRQCPITNGTNEVDMTLFDRVLARDAAKKAAR